MKASPKLNTINSVGGNETLMWIVWTDFSRVNLSESLKSFMLPLRADVPWC